MKLFEVMRTPVLTKADSFLLSKVANGQHEFWALPKDTIERFTTVATMSGSCKIPYGAAKMTRDVERTPEECAEEWFRKMSAKSKRYLLDYWLPMNTVKEKNNEVSRH
jgi:hypothetical protein